MLDFVDINNTFKINWLKKCLLDADSILLFFWLNFKISNKDFASQIKAHSDVTM